MTPEDLEQALTPEAFAAAEAHVRERNGETLEPQAAQALQRARASDATRALLDALDEVDAQLVAASREAQPGARFAARVMAALPSDTAANDSTLQPSPVRDPGSAPLLISEARRSPGLRRFGAAAACVAALGLSWLGIRALQDRGAAVARIEMLPGSAALLDADGKPAGAIAPGKLYQVSKEGEAVFGTANGGRLRLLQETRFRPQARGAAEALHLQDGLLFAYEPGGAEPLVVKSTALDAKVEGVSMVFQEEAPPPGAPNPDRRGQGIVMVFSGSAQVAAAHASGAVEVRAGEMYVSDLERENVQVFLDTVEKRVETLKQTADAGALHAQRALYSARVDEYRRTLKELDAGLAQAEAAARGELTERRARVAQYLEAHERRLGQLERDAQAPTPAGQACKLERAAGAVRRGRERYRPPDAWTGTK
ncbi:MAG: hypothetical protein AMXMBFR7_10680 [Planctomycetota bacterium]